MPYFHVRRYRPYEDPFNRLFGDQLDLFDPWQDLDTHPTALNVRPNAFRWVLRPKRSSIHNTRSLHTPSSQTPHSEKFRVQLNVAGFNPETVSAKAEGRKVIVEAKQEDRQPDGDYNVRQLRKSYELPEHADASQLISYVTPNNMLVIEVPIRNPETERRMEQAKKDQQNLAQFGQNLHPLFDYAGFLSGSEMQSRIVDKGNDKKQLEMTLAMKDHRPQEMKVSVKNNELIIQGEHVHKDDSRSERTFFYRSVMLPPGTQVDQLQSHMDENGQLKIEAPFIEQKESQQTLDSPNQQDRDQSSKK